MWRAARKSGPRAPSTRTSCCCSRAPRQPIRSRSARRGCRSFWSTCARNPRRLRLRRGVRHRTKIPRNAPLPGRADLDEPHSRIPRRARARPAAVVLGSTMPGDLEGILVVSVEQAVAAPYASSRLADAGARVIKVERPEGDFARRYDAYVNGESAYFVWLNRGKESAGLDLKEAADRRLLARMVEKADVFIQNLAPGVIDRL